MVLEGLFESIGISSLQGTLFGIGLVVVLVVVVFSIIKHKGKGIGDTDEKRALKKQRRLEKKEQRKEKKAMKDFLSEEILGKKLKQSENDLREFRKDIKNSLTKFIALLEKVLEFFSRFKDVRHSSDMKQKIQDGLHVLVEYLKAFGKLFKSELEVLDKDKELLHTMQEKIKKENKALEEKRGVIIKEFIALRQSFKRGEKLDQRDREATLQNHLKVIQKILGINGTILSRTDRIRATIESDEKMVHTISDEVHDFHDNLHSHRKEGFVNIVQEITRWFIANQDKIIRSVSNESTLAAFLELFNKKMSEKAALYKDAELLISESKHFTLEQEAALQEAA